MPQPTSARRKAARGDAKAAIVETGALAFFRHEHIIGRRIIDHPGDQPALALKADETANTGSDEGNWRCRRAGR